MEGDVSVVIVSALVFLSGLAVIWMAMQSRRQIREMEHRERLAMIERGLVPGIGVRARRHWIAGSPRPGRRNRAAPVAPAQEASP